MTPLPPGAPTAPRGSWGAWIVTQVTILALLWPLFFLLTNPLRLAFVADTFVPFVAVNLLLSLLAAGTALAWIDRIRLGGLDIALLGALALTALATDWDGPSPRDIAVDIVKPGAFVLTVIAIRELADVGKLLAADARTIRRVAWLLGAATALVVTIAHLVSLFVLPLYPAYASVDALLPLAALATAGAGWATLGFLLVLVASGKRGVYLAAIVVVWIARRHWLRRPQMVAVAALFAGGVALAAALGPDWLAAHVLKIGDPSGDIALQASGYRTAEIAGALATMREPLDWLLGKGFGFAFEAPGFVGYDGDDEAHRNLHFTPLSILVYYGLLFFVPFYALIALTAARALRLVRDGGAPAAVGAFYLGSLAFSFTEFSVFVYASFAVSCGLVLALDPRRRAAGGAGAGGAGA